MKKITQATTVHTLTGLALALAGSCAFATDTWDLTTCSGSENLGTTETCSNTGSAAGLVLSGYSNDLSRNGNGTMFRTATLYDWGTYGLGIVSADESNTTGPHAMDGYSGIDAMMIQFSTAPVTLSSVKIGWNGTDDTSTNSSYHDSDLSVFAWKGSSAPTPTTPIPTGSSPNTLVSSGWTLINNFANVGDNTDNKATVTTSIYSSYWLISAYSSAYGGDLTQGDDSFKLLALAGNACVGTVTTGNCVPTQTNSNVPEPTSLALMGAALMGFVATRRRKQKSA